MSGILDPKAELPPAVNGLPSQLSLECSTASSADPVKEFNLLALGEECNFDVGAILLVDKLRRVFEDDSLCSRFKELESPYGLASGSFLNLLNLWSARNGEGDEESPY